MEGRADKKVRVGAHVTNGVAEVVHDVAWHLRMDMGNTARLLCLVAANDTPTLNKLAQYFWRGLEKRDVVWPGHVDHLPLSKLITPKDSSIQRLYMRFSRDEAEDIDQITFALGEQRAHAVAALITLASKDLRVIQLVAPQFQFRSPYSLKRGSFLWASSARK